MFDRGNESLENCFSLTTDIVAVIKNNHIVTINKLNFK